MRSRPRPEGDDDAEWWAGAAPAKRNTPLVVVGLFRYLQLAHRDDAGEEPENVLLGDVPILVTVVAWAVLCAVILVAA